MFIQHHGNTWALKKKKKKNTQYLYRLMNNNQMIW